MDSQHSSQNEDDKLTTTIRTIRIKAIPRITVSPRASIENKPAESAVGNKNCRKYILLHLVANYDRQNPSTRISVKDIQNAI